VAFRATSVVLICSSPLALILMMPRS